MKHYYIYYPRNFSNEYDLCWVYAGSKEEKIVIANGYERISLRAAIQKCRNERYARKHDQSFSGFGAAIILPYGEENPYSIYYGKYSTNDGYVYA